MNLVILHLFLLSCWLLVQEENCVIGDGMLLSHMIRKNL